MKSKIGYKLVLALTCITLPAIGIFSYVIISTQYSQLFSHVKQQTHQLSELLKNSTKYDMLENQREHLHRVIKGVSEQEGIDKIRIFNKEGKIIFSTHHADRGTMVDKRAEACYACHAAGRPIEKLTVSERSRIFTGKEGERVLGMINPIYNEPSCWQAACHAHQKSQTVLGVLDFTVSLKELDREIQSHQLTLVSLAAVMIVVISLLLWLLVQRMVARPVGKLADATAIIAEGDLSHRLEVESKDELGNLAHAFNSMMTKLSEVQHQLYQQDKLASVGRLAAGFAHEINNPLTGILTFSSMAMKRAPENSGEREELEVIVRETKRCRDIVRRLLDFARQSAAKKTNTDLNEVVERSLKILDNQLAMNTVTVNRRLSASLPIVQADSNQIQQVLINLIMNGVDAMEDAARKELTITTRPIEKNGRPFVQIEVSDTGKGIPNELRNKIFEPFFTTKDQKGTGLGLSVVWGIVEEHQGTIEIKSASGEGTSFVLELPVHPG